MATPVPGGGGAGGGDARMASTSGRCVSLRGALAGSVPDDVAASSGLTDAEGVWFPDAEASADRDTGAKVGAVTLPVAIGV